MFEKLQTSTESLGQNAPNLWSKDVLWSTVGQLLDFKKQASRNQTCVWEVVKVCEMDCAIGAQREYQEILVCEQHSDQKKRRNYLWKSLTLEYQKLYPKTPWLDFLQNKLLLWFDHCSWNHPVATTSAGLFSKLLALFTYKFDFLKLPQSWNYGGTQKSLSLVLLLSQ